MVYDTIRYEPPRELRPMERAVLDYLLAGTVSAASALNAQTRHAFVVAEYPDNTGVKLVILGAAKPADVRHRIPVEAEALDADGGEIHILLHVVNGYLDEIEIYRDDGEPVKQFPDAQHLWISAAPG